MKSNILNKITLWSMYLIAFLLPIFYLPFTAEVIEINKQFLLYFLVIVALVSWLMGGIMDKKLSFVRTSLEIPLAIFLAITFISTLISVDRRVSFWGDYRSLSFGMVPLLFYTLLFVLALNTINTVKRLKTMLVGVTTTGGLSALYFILHFAKVLPIASLVKYMPAWNTVASLNSMFGLFMVLCFCVSFTFLMLKSTEPKEMIFWGIIALLSLATIALIAFKSVWLMLVAGIFLLLVLAISILEHMRLVYVSVAFSVFVVAVLFAVLGTPKIMQANLPTEVSLSGGLSWEITTTALSDNLKQFALGTGPGTFFYDFSKFRPSSFNQNFLWSVRFSKPIGTMFDILATTGLLGGLSFLIIALLMLGILFIIWLSVAHFKIRKSRLGAAVSLEGEETWHRSGEANINLFGIFIAIAVAWTLLLVSSFVANFSTVHWVLFFLLLAMIYNVAHLLKAITLEATVIQLKVSPQYTLVTSFAFILIFTGLILISIFISRFYTAEVYYAKGAEAAGRGDLGGVTGYLGRAVKLNSNRAKFHLDLSQAYITRGSIELNKNNPDQNLISNALGGAVDEAKLATSLSPNSVDTWEFLAQMYANAQTLAPEANRFRIQALEKAIELEPTNPSLHLSMAQARLTAQDVQAADKSVSEALKLKSDYAAAYYLRGTIGELKNNIGGAIEDFATALSLSPKDATVAFNLGRLYYNRAQGDDLARAEQLFLYAIQLNSNYADALWSAGLLYERKGQTGKALEYFRKVQILNPSNSTVRQKINAIGG